MSKWLIINILQMNKSIKFLYFTLLLSLFSACSLFDGDTDQVVEDYEVSWVDLFETRSLQKGEQVVPPYVFAAGHDSRFVFAKRHEVVLVDRQACVDESVVYYYILERTKKSFQDNPIYGPLSEEDFKKKCTELGIKKPKFKHYSSPIFLNTMKSGKN